MARKKVNKSLLVTKKKNSHREKLNPFEVRINRKKQNVLGHKIERNERGLPGVSRSRAIQKRKKTLLKEYRNRDKQNNVVDKRFGESDGKLSHEEKMLQRQIIQAKRRHQRSSIYNLEEDEELTHYGQSLGDIESFDDLQLSSDDNEVDDTETHFGGFLKKKKQSSESGETLEKRKSRKETIEEIVAKSKLYKLERQKEKEKIEELLEVVDSQWRNIQSVVMKPGSGQKANEKKVTEVEDYDRYLLELEAQPRAMASERIQTDEERAQIKTVELEVLEKERQLRMRGENNTVEEEVTVSGDCDIQSSLAKGDRREMVHYQNGNMVLPPGVTSLLPTREEQPQQEEEEENCNSDEGKSAGDSGEESSGCDGEDSYPEENGECSIEDHTDPEVDCSPDTTFNGASYHTTVTDVTWTDEELQKLLADKSAVECGSALDQVIAFQDPAKSQGNVGKMEALFTSLLNYCLSLAESLNFVNIETINLLAKPLFKSALASPTHTASCVQSHLQESFRRYKKLKKGSCDFPTLRDLVLFQIVGLLFPPSDFCHPVTTPTIHLMTLSLSKGSVQCVGDVIKGLFVCQTLLECISLSKRFIPELANFVISVLSILASNNGSSCTVIPPFTSKRASALQKSLTLSADQSVLSLLELMICTTEGDQSSNCTGLSLLAATVKQAHQLSVLWQHNSSFDAVFNPMKRSLEELRERTVNFSEINRLILNTLSSIENGLSAPKPILQLLRQKPKSIKFFEPIIDQSYQPGKKRYSSNKRLSQQFKLKHRYKRELKGAVREIRKDNKFLARERMKEQIDKDAVRKSKVKQIFGWLQQERGESRSERLKNKKTDNKTRPKKA